MMDAHDPRWVAFVAAIAQAEVRLKELQHQADRVVEMLERLGESFRGRAERGPLDGH